MIAAKQIDMARAELNIPSKQIHMEKIQTAYEWLDAQVLVSGHTGKIVDYEGLISHWSGVGVSRTDIEIAAFLVPEISGIFPNYNVSLQLTLPSSERLRNVATAHLPKVNEHQLRDNYRFYEVIHYSSPDDVVLLKAFHSKPLPAPSYDKGDFCERNDCECYYCVYGR